MCRLAHSTTRLQANRGRSRARGPNQCGVSTDDGVRFALEPIAEVVGKTIDQEIALRPRVKSSIPKEQVEEKER